MIHRGYCRYHIKKQQHYSMSKDGSIQGIATILWSVYNILHWLWPQFCCALILVVSYRIHPTYAPIFPWWRRQMETFSALPALCASNSPVTGEFPSQRPVTRSFDVFFDLRLNKRLSKLSWGWCFETPPYSPWRHCNVYGGPRWEWLIGVIAALLWSTDQN